MWAWIHRTRLHRKGIGQSIGEAECHGVLEVNTGRGHIKRLGAGMRWWHRAWVGRHCEKAMPLKTKIKF